MRRGFPADEVGEALSRLTELGYVDDAAFASGLVRRRGRSHGALAIAGDLAARGVSRAVAGEALTGLDGEVQLAAATDLARRLAGRSEPASEIDLLARIGPKLLRRGFPRGVIRSACHLVWAETGPSLEG
jgi:regulatory protein